MSNFLNSFSPITLLLCVALCLVVVLLVIHSMLGRADDDRDHDEGAGPVDPWAMQSELMRISGQPQPLRPEVNNNTVFYASMILEEGSETMEALADALARHWQGDPRASCPLVVANCAHVLARVGTQMLLARADLKALLSDAEPFAFPLSRDLAAPIFDGTTDLAVVNSGFALSAGLPGAAGYAEVADSNLSKRNPATGVIDKTPDGKWIKGAMYRAPALDSVLEEHCYVGRGS